MGHKYIVYEIQLGEVEETDGEGRVLSQKGNLVPIATKTQLKQLVKETPERIFLEPIPNISGEIPYQGFLLHAPHDQRLIVEGRKTSAPPKNPLEMMMQAEFGNEIKTFIAAMTWSERSNKWMVTS